MSALRQRSHQWLPILALIKGTLPHHIIALFKIRERQGAGCAAHCRTLAYMLKDLGLIPITWNKMLRTTSFCGAK